MFELVKPVKATFKVCFMQISKYEIQHFATGLVAGGSMVW
jgi:hypothetical protein